MSVRKCSTCKHYEPAPIWRKGWCRNPLLYSPQQSHLVGEDDLDCDRGMGNYWEPIDQELTLEQDTASYGFVAAPQHSAQTPADEGDVAPAYLHVRDESSDVPERRGGDVSQYGGPGRPTGSGDFGPGGSGDGGDDRYTAPFNEQGGDPYDDDRPPFGYQEEERYWTDYLRIAAPVVGVILMLGLVWFWVANMLGDDEDDFDNTDEDVAGPVIDADTPEATEESEGDEPIAVTTPDSEETTENGDATEEQEQSPTTLGPGATAAVVGTGDAGLNVRADASTEAEVVDSVPDGTELTITGESQQADGFTWWPVDTGEVTGFVAEDFIELTE